MLGYCFVHNLGFDVAADIHHILESTFLSIKFCKGAIMRLAFSLLALLLLGYSISFAAAGDLKWRYQTGDMVSSSPALASDGTIYVGSNDGKLYALNSNGTLKWSYATGPIEFSSPAIGTDGTVYVGSRDRNLYAIDPDGTLKWKYATMDEISGSPALAGDGTVYLGSRDKNLYAINPDGTRKWTFPTDSLVWGSPAIGADGTIYVGSVDGKLYAFNAVGTLKWSYAAGGAITVSPAIGADGTVYFGSWDNNKLYALNTDGTLKWSFNTGGALHGGSPAIGTDGTIYIGSVDHKVYALNPDGTLKWSYTTGWSLQTAPVVGNDGTIYVGSCDNKVHAITADGTLKWSYTTGNSINSSPALGTNGILYVGSDDHYLYAIDTGTGAGLADSPWPKFQHDLQNTGRAGASGGLVAGTLKFKFRGGGLSSPAIYSDGTIYSGRDSSLYAINSDNTLKWEFKTGGIVICSPAVGTDGIVYIGSFDKNLYAVNPNGTLKWRYTTTGEIYSSPALGSDGTIYLGSCHGGAAGDYFYAINPDGTLKWRYFISDGGIASSPALADDGTIYVGAFDDNLYAFKPDGTVKWFYTTGDYVEPGTPGNNVEGQPAIGSDGTVYVGSFDGRLYAINPDGSLKWRYATGDRVYSGPALGSDGSVYFGSFDKNIYALNSDGNLKWSFATDSLVWGSPALGADGTIYVGSFDGRLYAINAGGTLKWSYTTGSAILSSPTVGSDGTLYVGSLDGYLYAINTATGAGLADTPWPKFHHDVQNTGSAVTPGDSTVVQGITLVSIPGGTFQMGGTMYSFEQPIHSVTVSTFQMSTKEITNSQYAAYLNTALAAGEITATTSSVSGVTGDFSGHIYIDLELSYDSNNRCWISFSGSGFSVTAGKENWPVVDVTWYGAKAFALKYGCDLPREAEWEYAARGGRGYEYGTDDGTISCANANYLDCNNVKHPVDVGSYPANPFGLYDLAGNVWELCNDWYGSYGSGNENDPQGPSSGTDRVRRGGYWGYYDYECRSAYRQYGNPDYGHVLVGFRVVRRGSSAGTLKFKYQAGDRIVTAPAIASDGSIYIGCWDSTLYALTSDGTLDWTYQAGGLILSCTAIGSDSTIYFGSWDHALHALNADGTLKWKYQTGDRVASSPAVGIDGTVYFGSLDNYLYALKSDGTLKWRFQTGDGVFSSPVIGSDGTIYFGSFDNHFYALNPDGSLKWEFLTSNGILSSPAIGSDGTVYFGNGVEIYIDEITPRPGDTHFYALNPDGTLKWRYVTGKAVHSSPALGSDGTIYFGSQDNSFYALNPDGSLKWSYKTGDAVDSGPAVGSDGTVYFGSFDGNLYALNADGTIKWNFNSGHYVGSPPTISSNGILYFGSWDNYLYALDTGTGAGLADSPWPKSRHDVQNTGRAGASTQPVVGNLKFTFETGGAIVSSPAIGSDRSIYFGCLDSSLYALNPDGTLKWSYKAEASIFSSPAVAGDGTVYFGNTLFDHWDKDPNESQEKYLYALTSDGTLRWKFKSLGSVIASPALGSDGTVYFGSNDNNLYALTADGTLKWKYQTGNGVWSSPAVGSDGTVYFGSFDHYFYALNSDGTLKWNFQTNNGIFSSPAIGNDGTVYFGTGVGIYVGNFPYPVQDNYFYAFNSDGTLKWKLHSGEVVSSSPAIGSDGTIYCGGFDSFLHAVKADGTEKWKFQTGGQIWSSPTLTSDGTVYFESDDGYLYALNADGTLKSKLLIGGGDGNLLSPAVGSDGTLYFGSPEENFFYALDTGTGAGLADSPWPKFRHDLRNTGSVQEAVVVPPVISSVEPSYLYQEAVDSVITITGENLIQGAKIVIGGGGILVSQTDFIDSQHLSAKVKVSASAVPGLRDVSVINPDGGTAVGTGLLEVKELPAVFEVKPFYVEQGTDSLRVAINGKGFTQNVTVAFSGTGANVIGLEYLGPNQLVALISVDRTASPGRRELYLTVSGIRITFPAGLEIRANLPPVIAIAASWSVNEGEELSFVVDGRDPEGGPVDYQTGPLPAGASLQGRAFTWSPGYDQAGAYTVRFTVTDRLGAAAQADVSINVANRNRAPGFYKLDNQKTMAGSAMTFNITAFDPDRERLELSHSGLPAGATVSRVNDTTFTFTWTPSQQDAGTFRTGFTVQDPEGAADRLSLALTVEVPEKAVNLPPVFKDTATFELEIEEGRSLELTVQAEDPNGDPVVVYARNLLQNADFDPVTSRFTFRPGFTQAGSYGFLLVATDGNLSTSRMLSVRVKDSDIPPLILPLADQEIFEGGQLTFVVTAVDSGGDALSYEAASLPRGASLDPLTGNFLFTPDYNQAGSYSIPVRVKDPAGNIAETTLSITVKNTNQPPRLTFIPNQFVQSGEEIELLISAVDPDGDSLNFDFQSSQLSSALFNKQSQIFTFTAGAEPDSFQGLFIVSDPGDAADSQLVTFAVIPPDNQPPQIESIAEQYYREGDTVSIWVAAQDPEGNSLTFSIANAWELPAAMRQIGSQGKYEFVVDYTLAGKYKIIVQVSDGSLWSTVQVIINIENVNRAPVLQTVGDRQVAEGAELSLTFSASDPDGDALSYELSSLPRGARFDKKIGRLGFTPDYDQADTLYLGVSVSDGRASASENFRLVVTNTNRPPKVRRVKDPVVEQGGLMEFEMEADDPDGDSAWVVMDTLKVPFLGGSLKGLASIRNRRTFFFDTERLISLFQQIPSAVLKFYAVDKYGARSEEEIVDLAVLRKVLEKITDLPPGLEKKLGFLDNYGVGVQVAIKNNSDKTISGDLEARELSGRLKPVPRGDETEMLLSSIMAPAGKRPEEPDLYTFLSAGGEELAFYGIRRGWGFDIRRGWGFDISQLATLTDVAIVFSYAEEDLPLEAEGFDEANLRLYGLDSLTGRFVEIENAVVNTDSNTVTFKLTNWNIVDYTLGVEISSSAAALQTLTVQMLVDNVPLETNRTDNTTGPYQIRAFAPEGSLVSNAGLYYRINSKGEYLSIQMSKIPGELYGYMAEIEGLTAGGTIQYYVEMFVNFETVSSPLNPEKETHELTVGAGLPGDVSGDGAINIFDLLDLLKVLSGQIEPLPGSDCDQNGSVNIFDLLELLKILGGK